MTTSERRGYNTRRFGHTAPRPENPALREIDRYAGELLTIESITIGIFASKFTAHVRYDDNTAFDIDVYKPEQELLTAAGYTLPAEKGTHEFHAEITTRFDRIPYTREWGLFIVTVEAVDNTVEPKVGGGA